MAGRRGRSTCHGHQQCRCWATRRRGAAQGGVLVGFIGCTPSISPPSPRKSRPFAAAAAAPLATVSAPLAAGEQLILEGVDAPAAAGGDGIVAIDLAAAARRRRPRCEPHCRQAASASSATTISACGSKSCRDATELSGVQVPSNTPSSARSGGTPASEAGTPTCDVPESSLKIITHFPNLSSPLRPLSLVCRERKQLYI